MRIRQGLSTGADQEVFREDGGNDFTAMFREPQVDGALQAGMPATTGEQLSAQIFGGSLVDMQLRGHAAARRSGDESEMAAEQNHPFDSWAEGKEPAQAAADQERDDDAAGGEAEEGPEEQAEDLPVEVDAPDEAEEDTHMVKMYKEIEQRSKDAEARQAAAESGMGLQEVPLDHPVALRLAELAAHIEPDGGDWPEEAKDTQQDAGSGAWVDSRFSHGAACMHQPDELAPLAQVIAHTPSLHSSSASSAMTTVQTLQIWPPKHLSCLATGERTSGSIRSSWKSRRRCHGLSARTCARKRERLTKGGTYNLLDCCQAIRGTLEIEPGNGGNSLSSGVLRHARMDEKPSIEVWQCLHHTPCSMTISYVPLLELACRIAECAPCWCACC